MCRLVYIQHPLMTLIFVAATATPGTADSPRGLQRTVIGQDKAKLVPMQGRVLYFRSGLYGDPQPLALCATDLSRRPKPLLVRLIPGTLRGLDRAARDCERICRIAREHGMDCVALRPCGRGNGSVFQGYGEVDVFEAIDAVRQLVPIDPDRISLTGGSMGGAGTWYLASHYPDFWSAAAPFWGYCDYRLWDKPGGTTFHRQPWEEFSWTSRGAAYRVSNLRHLALRFAHGAWDRAVGGGVPVEHSRQMHRKLTKLEIPHTYIEIPKAGHSGGPTFPSVWDETVAWMLQQKRVRNPDHVSIAVHTLRHNRSHWVAVEQQSVYGKASTVDARFSRSDALITVHTENVRRLAIGPIPGVSRVKVELDGAVFANVDATGVQNFLRSGNSWRETNGDIPAGEKRPGLSGPFGDLFVGPTLIVYGESGSDAETHFNRLMATNAVRVFNQTNGGVHRGGIPGDNVVQIPILSDKQMLGLQTGRRRSISAGADGVMVHQELVARSNLFFIGNYSSNAALARLAADLPVSFGQGTLELAGKSYRGDQLAFFSVLPHPDGKRYVALLSGNEPDAICWGSHTGLQLLPDYLVFDHARVVDWGFFANDWRQGG